MSGHSKWHTTKRHKAVIEHELPELPAARNLVHMREDDMRRPDRAGAGVGFLDELTLVGGVHHQHAGLDAKLIENFLDVADIFSRQRHSRQIEIDRRLLGDFAQFGGGAEQRHAQSLAKHRQTLAGIGFIRLELHHASLAAPEKHIGRKLLA